MTGHLRESEIRAAIRAALAASGAFDAVRQRLPEELGSGDGPIAAVQPESTERGTGWDSSASGEVHYTHRVRVTVAVRVADPETVDDEAEALWGAVVAAVDGVPLVPGLTEPDSTFVAGWRWEPSPLPERRITGTAAVGYAMPWGGFR